MKHLGDIAKIHGDKIEPVDCITFGSPCQGLSMAGKRLGFNDDRSVLFLDAARIIKEMRTATNGMYPRPMETARHDGLPKSMSLPLPLRKGDLAKNDYLLSQLHITPPSLPRHLREVQGREERLRGAQGVRA